MRIGGARSSGKTLMQFAKRSPAPGRTRDAPDADSPPTAAPARTRNSSARLCRNSFHRAIKRFIFIRSPRNFSEDVQALRILIGRRTRAAWSIPPWPRGFVRCGAAHRPAPVPPPDAFRRGVAREFAIFIHRIVVALGLHQQLGARLALRRRRRRRRTEVFSALCRPRRLPPRSACCSRHLPERRLLSPSDATLAYARPKANSTSDRAGTRSFSSNSAASAARPSESSALA